MKYFTRKATIQIGTDSIFFHILSLDNEEEGLLEFSFYDIKSYKIQYPTSRFACLTLTLNSGTTKQLSFLRRPFNDSQSNTEAVIESIHSNFKQFSLLHKELNVTRFEPSFYGSKNGLHTILLILVLLIIPNILAIELHRSLPSTLLGSVLIIAHLLNRRIAEVNFYKKMKSD